MSFEQFKIERLGFNSVDECFPSDSESDDEMLTKTGIKWYFSVRMDDGTMHLIPSYPNESGVFDFEEFLEDLIRQGKVPLPVIEKLRLDNSKFFSINIQRWRRMVVSNAKVVIPQSLRMVLMSNAKKQDVVVPKNKLEDVAVIVENEEEPQEAFSKKQL
ncbi:hypothetical protein QVD17_21103 [Tagetes erecta]|uniref:Uncharacterized protein n=1 Tax=Tagetes erecta TaxID=13708 RepID=A0AAD8NXT5_TARER|nr:hypothetical protein QVD17_21103 [Tagetes erecta]